MLGYWGYEIRFSLMFKKVKRAQLSPLYVLGFGFLFQFVHSLVPDVSHLSRNEFFLLVILSSLLVLPWASSLCLVILVRKEANTCDHPLFWPGSPWHFKYIYFFILRWILTVLSRLVCSGVISTHCNAHLLCSSDPHASASQVTGTTGVYPTPS